MISFAVYPNFVPVTVTLRLVPRASNADLAAKVLGTSPRMTCGGVVRSLLLAGMIGLSGCSASSSSTDVGFKCFANSNEKDVRFASVYVASSKTKIARKVSNEERIGEAEITDSIIKMNFKADDKSWPLEVRINRYTGAATHEHGDEEMGEFSSKNVLYEMTCEKIKEKKL